MSATELSLLRLHTYFLFPFVIDRGLISNAHPEFWPGQRPWIDGLDKWISSHADRNPVSAALGCWRRSAYDRFDMDSPAYRDMVFFHPFVRRVFFDTKDQRGRMPSHDALIRCYTLPASAGKLLWYTEDLRRRSAEVQVTDLRLFLFANGVGMLSIGVEKEALSLRDGLWINEMFRKIYPSSGRQRREGRVPCMSRLVLENGGESKVLAEETFEAGDMLGFQPPLSKVVTSLLHFMDYDAQEYEPVLDERMVVYTYGVIDQRTAPEDFVGSRAQEVAVSRFLYVDRAGEEFRYDPDFIRESLRQDLYTRWAHEGTYYGFTSYSNITVTASVCDRGEHILQEGDLIHRMFNSRYYLMAVIALFYRATLLDFAERVALVSRRLYQDQEASAISRENLEIATSLRAEFLHFSNYWYFDELANKDEEIEHFSMQCQAYRLDKLKKELEEEIEKLNASLYEHSQNRSTEAVNRLAVISMILGAGAVLTGFFGMNFGKLFSQTLFEPSPGSEAVYWLAIVVVSTMAFGALTLGIYLIAINWQDYRESLRLRRQLPARHRWFSLRE